jgi:hypothetical protein
LREARAFVRTSLRMAHRVTEALHAILGIFRARVVRGIGTSLVLLARSQFETTMALPFGETPGARDPRALAILARTIYRELRTSGFEARDVIALAGELLGQVTSEFRRRGGTPRGGE